MRYAAAFGMKFSARGVDVTFESCTYNQLTFKKENNLVFDVDIPCIGTAGRFKYNLKTGSSSGDDELYGLAQLAKQYLEKTNATLSKNWSTYRRKILIFPLSWYTDWAGFAGMAMVGCAPRHDCYTWINPGVADDKPDMPVVFQELGHNIGLAHSSRVVCDNRGNCARDEYGDPVDPMGATWPNDPQKHVVCTNAAQSYKAGWSSPTQGGHLSLTKDLTPGVPRVFTLPAMALNKANMLRIITDRKNPSVNNATTELQQRALFVSYRVHEYNETANGIPANLDTPPIVLAMLTDNKPPPEIRTWGVLNGSFTQLLPDLGGVSIQLKSKTPQAATVSVCWFLSIVESSGDQSMCSDGLDNDCDGLVDAEDPDCKAILQPPPKKPSRPPNSPPPQQQQIF
ncbi:hypothetical protein VOLCADRAFT_99754 [Volvox carteri f. nagariensis]|uniref:Peptidase M11 gametolysin domain-containing protein n=1 Tax=Volvox carteri f. nagariensis TaxID=3068 RepID=D8UIK3_VOLCA|nr:uncharacterized protein VOLCADRAFT_99754 [Volvox carteri f. nagariensis]EFJ40409.1 hypothetical protein VOLCADRAFT_99754 [Volvox carteri f. nagariensis]|eukprot:XP_002958489.1 hypothetical protein VOLCADRAFT_99754 [Volvox carteri f. nagariensis]